MRASRFPLAAAVLAAGLLATLAVAQNQPAQPPVKIVKGKKQPVSTPDPNLSDDEALKKAGLTAGDGPKLIEYLKQRTLSNPDQSRITSIIQRFGADDFDDRVKATEEIELFGPAAVGPLKAAEKSGDPEVAFRAKLALKKMEKVPHSSVASAAIRAVMKLKPEGAAEALIGFLPLADNESVADAIRDALVSLAVKDGKAEPALVAALADVSPVRRAAAYLALTEGGPDGPRIRIKDAYPKVREAVLKDADPEARFLGLWSLALTTREKEYVPELIGLIPKLPRGRIWQLEELLLQLAGAHPKDGRFLKSPESLTKARDAWQGWWKDKGEKVDFAAAELNLRVTGNTDIIEMDPRGYGQGRVVSLGPDLKEKWRITGVNNPTDLKVAPNGNVLVAESNLLVTERTTGGAIVRRRNLPQQAMSLEIQPDGKLLIACRHQVFEWDKDWDKNAAQAWTYTRPGNAHDIAAARRLPNGEVVFVTAVYQNPNPGVARVANCFRLDAKGQDLKKTLTLNQMQNMQSMDVIGEDKILVCELENLPTGQQNHRVSEYDLKTGKQVWKHDCPAGSVPTSCQRLPNGNTLITLMNLNQVIEVDPSGEIVWDYQAKDGLRVSRAYRR